MTAIYWMQCNKCNEMIESKWMLCNVCNLMKYKRLNVKPSSSCLARAASVCCLLPAGRPCHADRQTARHCLGNYQAVLPPELMKDETPLPLSYLPSPGKAMAYNFVPTRHARRAWRSWLASWEEPTTQPCNLSKHSNINWRGPIWTLAFPDVSCTLLQVWRLFSLPPTFFWHTPNSSAE